MAQEKKPAEKKSAAKKPPVERTFVKVSDDEPKKATAKAAAPAETSAKAEPAKAEAAKSEQPTPAEKTEETVVDSGKNPMPYRIFAFLCWAVAIGGMVFAIISLIKINTTNAIIGVVVAALGCLGGALLWKAANKLRPLKSTNKFVRFLYYQLGTIVTFVVFLPIGLVLLLGSKNLDKKSKTIVGVIAAVLLVVVGLVAAEWNPPAPISAEELEQKAANGEIDIPNDLPAALTDTAYWTPFGTVYHLDPNCYHIMRSSTVYEGTLADAINSGLDRGCSNCASGTTVIPSTTPDPDSDTDYVDIDDNPLDDLPDDVDDDAA